MGNKLGVLGVLLLLGVAFAGNSGTSNVTLGVGNSAPNIESVSTPAAFDPNACAVKAVPVIQVNVSDADGYADVNLTASYVNVTNAAGTITHPSTSCIEDTHGATWIVMNCTGAEMNYYDIPAATWKINAYTQDNSITPATDTMAGTDMTYNERVHMQLLATPITFGTLYSGSSGNNNTNTGFAMENCGNVALTSSVQGANITDGGSNIMDVSNFKLSTAVTEGSGNTFPLDGTVQAITNGGILVSTGSVAKTPLYSWVSIPVGQVKATYNTGVWTFTTAKA